MDHTNIVASVKAQLQAQGVSLLGPCGAFEITRRVAWQLRGEGAGLLSKSVGNNCQSFSVDIVMYQDGSAYDMLTSSGDPGGNGPIWNQIAPVSPDLWRVPSDPGGGEPPEPPEPPLPPGQNYDARFDRLETMLAGIAGAISSLPTIYLEGTVKIPIGPNTKPKTATVSMQTVPPPT